MKWTCTRPGLWEGTDGTNTATAHKCMEGVLYGAEWMWSTRLNGEWITNANTLADAKQAVKEALA